MVLLFSLPYCANNRLTRQKLGGSDVGSKPTDTASGRLFMMITAPNDEYLDVRVLFFCCSVSYVIVKELDDSAFLLFVWTFLYLFLPAGNLCRFLSTTALGPSRESGPASHFAIGSDAAHSSCPRRSNRHSSILRLKGAVATA